MGEKIKELGIHYIEASADTELDPLYMGHTYLYDWVRQVREAEAKYGVKVANLYSGHGSYTTLGLTHPDGHVRRNLIDNWFFPLLRAAAELDAGAGFSHTPFRTKHFRVKPCTTALRTF